MSASEKMRHRKIAASNPTSTKKSNNPWIKLVNETRRKFPHMNLKEAMVYSKPIYAKMKGKQ